MNINEIKLCNFRNFRYLETQLDKKGMIVTGKNGSGKSNFLEAISYLAFGKSCRSNSDTDLVTFNENEFRVDGLFFDNGIPLKVSCSFGKNLKLININLLHVKKLSELYQYIKVINFFPEDIQLIDGSPKNRRLFIDQAITQYDLEYLHLLKRYNRVLKQRNSLLKETTDLSIKRVWDEQLVSLAFQIIRKRKHYIEILLPFLSNCYQEICYSESISLKYLSTMKFSYDETEFMTLNLSAIMKNIDKEIKLQRTIEGPHLDDIFISINSKSARVFASHGQKKSIAIALKMSHSKLLEADKNDYPIMIFDDIFANLDQQRSKKILGMINDRHQIFIATPSYKNINFPELSELNLEILTKSQDL